MNISLARLTRLVPPASTPAPKDWSLIGDQMGTVLPRSYKGLIDTYGGGRFDGCLWLLEPGCANKGYDLLVKTAERTEAYEGLWNAGEQKPGELEIADSRLIPWVTTDNGEYAFRLVRPGQDPDAWTVMANEARAPEWEHHAMTCAEFLVSILTGEVRSEIFWEFPQEQHEFIPSGNFV